MAGIYSICWSQTHTVKGIIRDAQNNEPLPFVSILINEGPNGTASDISGRFEIKNSQPIQQLTFSYVGYESRTFVIPNNGAALTVRLQPKASSLREVVVRASYNPAHRIIKLATQNRKNNDPAQLPQYTYRVYNKTYATFSPSEAAYNDSIIAAIRKKRNPTQQQSNESPRRSIFDNSYLFMAESVSDHAFLKPDLHQETVLATRISGWDNPQVAILASNSQEFSIYKDLVTFFEKTYVSPLSEGSTNKYDFQLQDTTYSGSDSVFIISYQPKANRNFEGLQGQLHISTNGWAAVNVLAETAGNKKPKNRLQQQYAKINGQKWFPVEANIETMIPMLNGVFVSAFSRTSFSDFELNPALKRRHFKAVTVKMNDDAGIRSEAYWAQHRPDSLSTKELRTYAVVDSIYTADGMDMGKIMEVIFTKQLPVGPVSIDIDRIFRFNRYEDTRLGVGAHTNSKISRFFSVGGYAGYGIRDKGFKYGGDLQFNLHKESGLKLTFAYAEDVAESGGLQLPFQDTDLLHTNYRRLAVKNMDKVTHQSAFLTVRTLKYLDLQTGFQQEYKRTTNGYAYEISPDNLASNFRFSEAVIGFRYAFREQLMQLFKTNYSLGTRYPVIWFQYRQGLDLNSSLNGQFAYHKYNARLTKTIKTKMLGSTTFILDGGLVNGNVPYPNLYNGNGARYHFYSTEGFQTMGMNEFLMDRYGALYLNHNLGKLLYRSEKFSPSLALVTNIGFGDLSNPDRHKNIAFKTMTKGFFESGLLVNNLYSYRNYYSVGAGVLYRYGAYQLPDLKDNLAFRITTSINL